MSLSRRRLELPERARAAYERGRVLAAVCDVALVVLAIFLSLLLEGSDVLVIGIGAVTAVLSAVVGWYGRAPGQSIRVGFEAGVTAFVGAALVRLSGCSAYACEAWCRPICFALGAGAAFAIAQRAHVGRAHFAIAAVTAVGWASLAALTLGTIAVYAFVSGIVFVAAFCRAHRLR